MQKEAQAMQYARGARVGVHTWNNVARIKGVLVLDEAEAIHEFDLSNLAGAMGVEVVLNVGLGSYSTRSS